MHFAIKFHVSFLFTFLSLSSFLFSQDHFPDKCIGTWTGTMYIYAQGQIRDSVDIKFTVAKTTEENTWTWKTEYLSPTLPMTKDYLLKLKDPKKNIYVTDEQNGIELEEYLFGNKLYAVFETGGILLTSSYELIGEQLIFEVTSGKASVKTGGEVQNYAVRNVQRVVLRREKE